MVALIKNKFMEVGVCKDQIFLVPTVAYNPKAYRFPETRPIYIMFLVFYVMLGKEMNAK